MLEDLKENQRSCFSVGPVVLGHQSSEFKTAIEIVRSGWQTDWWADIRSNSLLVHFLRQYAIKSKEPTQISVVLKSVCAYIRYIHAKYIRQIVFQKKLKH